MRIHRDLATEKMPNASSCMQALMIRITDPAPLVSDMERRRYRRVWCICLVRRDGHHTPTLVNGYTITPAGAKETLAGIAL
jgi:hypothetical protein